MPYLKKYIIFFFIFFFIVGCKKEWTYTDLIEQPALLDQQIEQCETTHEATEEKAFQCSLVMQASTYFSSLVNQQKENPEQFGERILQAEMLVAEIEEELRNQEKQLKFQNETQEQLKKTQSRLEETRALYEARVSEVKVLLAVIGKDSPE